MENQLNINFEADSAALDQLAERQDYLDYIDTIIEGSLEVKAAQLAPEDLA